MDIRLDASVLHGIALWTVTRLSIYHILSVADRVRQTYRRRKSCELYMVRGSAVGKANKHNGITVYSGYKGRQGEQSGFRLACF